MLDGGGRSRLGHIGSHTCSFTITGVNECKSAAWIQSIIIIFYVAKKLNDAIHWLSYNVATGEKTKHNKAVITFVQLGFFFVFNFWVFFEIRLNWTKNEFLSVLTWPHGAMVNHFGFSSHLIRSDVAAPNIDIWIIRNDDAALFTLHCFRRHYFNRYHVNEGHWCQRYAAFAENKTFTARGMADSILQKCRNRN